MSDTFTKYTAAIKSKQKFEAENSEIVQKLVKMEEKIEELRLQVVQEARVTLGIGMENKVAKVVVVPVWRKWYDYSSLWDAASSDEKDKLIKLDCVKTEVDKENFELALKNEDLPRTLAVAAFREEELTPRVQIKLNE